MRFFLAVILFFGAVSVFTGVSKCNHRKTVEAELTKQSEAVLKEAGFADVAVEFDHFNAVLGGVVDSEEEKQHVVSILEDMVPGAYIPRAHEAGVKIRPTLPPWVKIVKEKNARTAILTGKLAATEEDHRKYIGSNLFVINGIDAIENDIDLDPQRLEFTQATEFASLAAELLTVSEFAELSFDEKGITIGGKVENEGIRRGLIEVASSISGGKVTDNLELKDAAEMKKPAEFHLVKSRFGVAISGRVPDLDSKAKLIEAVTRRTGARLADQLNIEKGAGDPFWLDLASEVSDKFLGSTAGDAELHFTPREVRLSGEIASAAKRDEIMGLFASARQTHPEMIVVSKIKTPEDSGTGSSADAPIDAVVKVVFDQETVTLSGRVPTEQVRLFLEKAASKGRETLDTPDQPDDEKVTFANELVVDSSLSHKPWMTGMGDLLEESIRRISSGTVTVDSGKVTLEGTTHSVEEKQIIQNVAINAFPTGFTLENLLDYSDQPFPSPNLMPEESQKLAEELKLLPVYFDKASEIIKDDQVEKVDKAAKAILAAGDEYELTVAGFADNIGNADYNRDLSIRRANEVRKMLIQAGVKPESMEVQSFGEDVSNTDRSELWKSRRVEIGLSKSE